MQSIVIAIDQPWRERVEETWSEIKAVFNLRQLVGQTDPHIVLHVADGYAHAATDSLARIAAFTAPFAVTCQEPAILRGGRHILYLPIERSPPLVALHAAILREVGPAADAPKQAYGPDTWAPHLTLAMGHLDSAIIPDIQQFLSLRNWRWELPVTNICLVPDNRSRTAVWTRWPLADKQ